jgi:uroporphyrinogen decarboxylase
MSFLAGLDVQQVLPNGTPEEVRAEVRFLIDTFDRPEGGMCIAAGNGPTPLENIEAFLEEVHFELKRAKETNLQLK